MDFTKLTTIEKILYLKALRKLGAFTIPKIRKEVINIDIYLIDESKGYTLHFPVNPLEKFDIPKEKKFTTADIIDFGETDIPQKGKKIQEINFNSFFPVEYNEAYCRYATNMIPQDYVDKLNEWVDLETPLRLLITDFNFNELVNINKFVPELHGGEIGDIYFTINFRTYKELKIETVNNSSASDLGGLQDNRLTQSGDFKAEDTVKVTASVLNVRDGPGTSYKILGSVKKGESLKLYRVQGNWADTYWGNHGGYICLDYVSR